MMECSHNQRTRYIDSFYCEDCNTVFDKNSSTYRSGELLDSIWNVLNNINVELSRKGKPRDRKISKLKSDIGINKYHSHDYEKLIDRAAILMKNYNKTSESATLIIK